MIKIHKLQFQFYVFLLICSIRVSAAIASHSKKLDTHNKSNEKKIILIE